MKASISRTWGPTPEKMLWIWNTVLKPSVTYGSLVWATRLTGPQKDRLNKLQRSALMQLGNFRFTTPGAGLGVILGQLPLDLELQNTAIKAYLRLPTEHKLDWEGKCPGAKGRKGHASARLRQMKQQQLGANLNVRLAAPSSPRRAQPSSSVINS